jgi:glycogen debranching enzyme
MPVDIRVGPPVLTINQGSTFMVTDLRGEIDPRQEHGVFAQDTRFVSSYRFYINEQPWRLITSNLITYYSARLYLTNPAIQVDEGVIPEDQIGLVLERTVGDGIHEDYDLTNYGRQPVRFMLEIAVRSDFADLFEVRRRQRVRRGRLLTEWRPRRGELCTSYTHGAFRRRLVFKLLNSDSVPHYANGRILFEVALAPGATWHTCSYLILEHEGRVRAPLYQCHEVRGGQTAADRLQRRWQEVSTRLRTSHHAVAQTYRQSVEDLGALRLYDQDLGEDLWIPAAGVPWYVALFGRDALIVSLQSMLVCPAFAVGTLRKLAEYQATARDGWRDAEPGKIPHELRTGELAYFQAIPHTPYYGTADATILYLTVLHEAWRWLGDAQLLAEYRPVAERCLDWIDHYGDRDGDGWQEYQTRSPLGYENMGWKDASDAVVYPDGSPVPAPKALCELQGYVYDAKRRMAEVFDALGQPQRAAELRAQAAELRRRFNTTFWVEREGCFAFGLDPAKRPIETVASNAGHCLWAGIAEPAKARRVAARLLQPDMWSGWGIRTLSAANPAYNPFSYQRGSVWPHDNALIAAGFKCYGLAAEANQVAQAVFDAASYFAGYRLPELYAGLARTPGAFPVQYLGANIPQAWAAGAVFHLLQTLLGLEADAPCQRLYVAPTLPDWLPEVELEQLRVGATRLTLRCWREGPASRWAVVRQEGAPLTVLPGPRPAPPAAP